MKVLNKTLKRKWFLMIESGVKREEYLEIKAYWMKRLMMDVEVRDPTVSYDKVIEWLKTGSDNVSYSFQDFDIVSANNGYQKNCPNVKWKHEGIRIGTGKTEWGAEPGKVYFVLSIGELIK